MRNVARISLLLLVMVAAGGCVTPRMKSAKDASLYYARASVRLGETGVVFLRFRVGLDGKVRGPIVHDQAELPFENDARSAARLIESAENYLREARFDSGLFDKRRLTASFVFEIKPCGTLRHTRRHDYAIDMCREPEIRPDIPMSSIARWRAR